MTFKDYKEFCKKADFYKRIYQNIEVVNNKKLKNEYRECWREYIYSLKIEPRLKNLIWDFLNDDVDFIYLVSFCR